MSNHVLKTLLDELDIVFPQVERKFNLGIPALIQSSLYDNASKTLKAVMKCPYCGSDITIVRTNGSPQLYHITENCPACSKLIDTSTTSSDEPFSRSTSYIVWFDTSLGDAAVARVGVRNSYGYDPNGKVIKTDIAREIYLIGYVDLNKREMFALNNGQLTKSNAFKKLATEYCQTFFEITGQSVCGVALPNKWYKKQFYQDVAAASEPLKTQRTTAPKKQKTFSFDPVSVPVKDITKFLYSPLETNSVDRTVKDEMWCTSCDTVFEITAKTDENVTVTCPNCGAEHTFNRRELTNEMRGISVLQTADLGDFYGLGVATAKFNENWEMSFDGFFFYCTIEKKTGKQRFYHRDNLLKPFVQKKSWQRYECFEAVYDPLGLNIKEIFKHGEIAAVANYITNLAKHPSFAAAAKDKNFLPFIKFAVNGSLFADLSKAEPWEMLFLDKNCYEALCQIKEPNEWQIKAAQKWSDHDLKNPMFFIKEGIEPDRLMKALNGINATAEQLQEYLEECPAKQFISPRTAEGLWRSYITTAKQTIPLNTEDEIFPESLRLAYDKVLYLNTGNLN